MNADEAFWTLLALGLVAYLLIMPALGLVAFRRSGRLRDEIGALRMQLADFRRQFEALRGTPPGEVGEAAPEPPRPPGPAVETVTPPVEQAQPEEPEPRPVPPAPAAPAVAARAAGSEPGETVSAWARLEESITSRWLVWLGGVTLALAGVFLVKYSIDRGWLGPTVRVTLGFLLGAALVGVGEWLRRRPLQQAIAALRPNYVPPSLTAAGLFTAFASLYAAYQLYALLPPFVAFVLLAAIAFAAVALAVLQGPFIAVLGLIGGFATPVLISIGAPSAWSLFAYLLALTVAALVLVRYMAWWWLAWAALVGAVLWALLWFAAFWSPGDTAALGSYLVLICGLFLLIRRGRDGSVELVAWPRGFAGLDLPDQVAWMAAAAVAGLAFILVRLDHYGTVSLVTLGVLAVLYLAAGYREAVFDVLALLAGLLTTVLVATWHLPRIVTRPQPLVTLEGQPLGLAPGPIVPPELLSFTGVTLAFALFFALAGFVALWGGRRPGLWATVSAATPVLLLTAAYWRIEAFGLDLKWSAVAVALAGLNVAAATRVARHRNLRGFDLVLGAYAAATISALSLAATMALEQAWLTVALSLQLPALAWIHDRLGLRPLRHVALAVAGVVLARLLFNYHVLDYPLGSVPGVNWVLYGYGIPAAAFWWAARRFRRKADDRLVMVLEAGALAFVTLLVTFEIRSLVAGSLAAGRYSLFEQSLQSMAWLGLAYGWLLQHRRRPRVPLLWAWRLLAGLSVAQTLIMRVILNNPLWTRDAVGAWPFFDLLLLTYAAPGLFALLFAREFRRAGEKRLAGAAALYGLGLIFVYITLEVRHLFHGAVLSTGGTSDAELYSYSAAWLLYALALLALGIWKGMTSLRYVSLALLLVTVGKVFLIDMAALTGLLRVASFLGLGLSLIGIGYFYQRCVFPPRGPKAAADGTGEAEPG
jgi:uncharacterized membrane protein